MPERTAKSGASQLNTHYSLALPRAADLRGGLVNQCGGYQDETVQAIVKLKPLLDSPVIRRSSYDLRKVMVRMRRAATAVVIA
jgi:hypothetical protein